MRFPALLLLLFFLITGQAQAQAPTRLFVTRGSAANGDELLSVNLAGVLPSGGTSLASGTANFVQPSDLLFDPVNGFIYVTDEYNAVGGGGGGVYRYTYNAAANTVSGRTTIVAGAVNISNRGLALDATNNRLYFTQGSATNTEDALKVVSGVSGSGPYTVTTLATGDQPLGNFQNPTDLVFDPVNNYVYLSDQISDTGSILRYTTTGASVSNRTTIIGAASGILPGSLALNSTTNRLYFTQYSAATTAGDANDALKVVDVSGSTFSPTTLVNGTNSSLTAPQDITLDRAGGFIYVANVVASSGAVYRYSLANPTSTETVIVPGAGLAGSIFTGLELNGGFNTASTTVTSLNRASTNPTNATSVSYTLTFGSSVTGITTSNFDVTTTGTISGAFVSSVSGSGGTYTVTVNTGTGSGTLTLRLANATGISPGISTALPFAGQIYDIDKVAPTVAISSTAGASGSTTTTSPIPFTVTFSENVTGFVAGDVTVTNGTITGNVVNGTSPGTVYTFTVTPTTAGTATTVSVPANVAQDAVGNLNTAAPASYGITYNQPGTTVTSVTRLLPSPTATTQVRYRVVFAASITGVTVSNFSLTTSGLTGTGISSVVGSGTTYTVTANTGTGTGTLRLNVQNSTGITPTVTGLPYTSGEEYSIIKSFGAAPLLSLRGAGSPTGNNDVTAFVDMVQVVQSGTSTVVTNSLQNGSFETNNAPAGGFLYQQNGVVAAPWTFTAQAGVSRNGAGGFGSTAPAGGGDAVALLQSFNGTNGSIAQNLAVPTGSYQVTLATVQRTNQASDQVVNMFLVEGSNTVFMGSFEPVTTYQPFVSAAFSVTAPALTATVSSTAAATGGTTTTTPIPFSVSFSASVGTSFTAADVTVTNGTVTTGSFSGSGAGPYTFTVTPTTPGTATTVSLAAGVAQDANNTLNTASNAYSVTYNQLTTAAPAVTVPSNGSTTNPTPSFGGTAPAGSTVRVYVDGVLISGTATADASGSWVRAFSGTPLASGPHTVYATAQLSGQAVSAPSPTNTFTVRVPATYTSSTVTQASAERVAAGSTNQAILQVAIVIGGGSDAPLNATSFSFTTNGSTSPADIAAARVYYTGTSATFAATNQFGSPVPNPNGSFAITGSRQLVTGTNYFWLVYDVAANATIGNVLDATAPSFVTSDGSFTNPRTPTTPDPAGNRQIILLSRVAGQALRFVGGTTPGYVNFSASTVPAPALGAAYTQVAWIKPAIGTGSITYYVLGNGTGNTAAPYIAITGNGRLETGFGTGTTLRSIQTGPQTIAANEWSQVAATFNGSLLSLYLNGNLLASLTAPGGPGSTRVNYVGSTGTTGSNFFPGDLDEVSQWDRALSQTELRLLRHLTLSGTEPGLASYLQFNEAGTTTTDGISGAVGTLTGATRVTSTAPVGAGVSSLQSVTGTGNYSFPGTNAAINFTAVTGAPYDVVVARLEGTPLGTRVSDPNLRSTHTRAYWIVDKYSTSTFTAAVTYTLDPGLISAGDAAAPSTLKLYKRGSNADGAFDAPISATAANAAASTVTFPVNSFSQTFIGTYGSSPLPVELVRFTAERKGNDALLQWATAQERNNAYFEVESSVDGRTFRAVGRVTGHGTSNQPQAYTLTDANLARYARSVVYYRLRQVDLDGTNSLSAVQTVQVPGVTSSLTALVFPNPAADQLTVRLSGPYSKAQGWLFDAQGRTVQELSRPLAAAAGSDIPLSVANLPIGVYTLRLVLDGQVLHQQIVVQR